MKPIIIDNFLKEEYFNAYQELICNTTFEFSWLYGQYSDVENTNATVLHNYFFTHIFYIDGIPISQHFRDLQHFVERIQAEGENVQTKFHKELPPDQWRMGGGSIKSILRMRANMFVNTSTLYEYPLHTDYPFSNIAVLLSLNTCDGYTGIKDEDGIVQNYNSVANRALIFDASELHCSSTTTDANARFNIIVNYL